MVTSGVEKMAGEVFSGIALSRLALKITALDQEAAANKEETELLTSEIASHKQVRV